MFLSSSNFGVPNLVKGRASLDATYLDCPTSTRFVQLVGLFGQFRGVEKCASTQGNATDIPSPTQLPTVRCCD